MFEVKIDGVAVSCKYDDIRLAQSEASVYRDNGYVNVEVEVI